MTIYILPVPAILQPEPKGFRYPAHNDDFGIEQDMLIWLQKQKHLLTNDPAKADRHYLPVFWTRWHINHQFAAGGVGLPELQAEVDKVIIDDSKTFTITQFDGGTLLDIGKTVVFTAARTINSGIDAPIICRPHRKPLILPSKKYLASFNGSFYTHPIRDEMNEKLSNRPGVYMGGMLPTRFYKRWFWATNYNLNTMASYIALAPRGTSCSSFRFFEAMQLGVAPCLIGDVDVRPFKNFIPWDDISYYSPTVEALEKLLDTVTEEEALEKGKKAYQFWKNDLYYQKWCKYVIKELELLS
ncbi:exostosin domain-containing protein [Mucilaginibacter myungsuensis]|uniref:Exostosin family protein n=1 Tax=Mucilaginibacter myungsuensis TaxID=649104 RepID=A0A929KSP8_9SPHI|nr:exostosin family protein [Mucilaginibacter myungsuensis]MBE9660821.1 exostosin family protein [Mucilaginibacter myungsuensis]MDN3600868.1 exostosin family protein [Mucilaginibacter myungsuensis]